MSSVSPPVSPVRPRPFPDLAIDAANGALALFVAVSAACAVFAVLAFPAYKGQPAAWSAVAAGLLLALPLATAAGRRVLGAAWHRFTAADGFLPAMLLLAALVRVPGVVFPPMPYGDHFVYHDTAKLFASGGGLGGLVFWPPGQPAWLGIVATVVGDGVRALAAVQSLVGVATVALLYRAWAGEREAVARCAATVAALMPSIVSWNATLGHETTTLFLMAVLLVLLRQIDARQGRAALPWVVAFGLVGGLASLVRPTMIVLPLLFGLRQWIVGHGTAAALRGALVTLLAGACVIAPYTARNHALYGEFCLVSANFGVVLHSANSPGSDGIYHEQEDPPGLNPVQRDRAYGRLARAHIVEEPGVFAARTVKRIAYMWGTDTSGLNFVLGDPERVVGAPKAALQFIHQVPWILLVVAWGAAAVRCVERRGVPADAVLPLLLIAVPWAAHALVEPLGRHHIPYVPLIAAACAMILTERGRLRVA
ncbi:MAG: hypothetical protein RJA99_537 [Pseudomonadota bacterium]|jgi:hypothetical protein